MKIGTYYFNRFGHHVVVLFGHYRMESHWIDTDNECWEEPYHLYGPG